MNPVQLRLAVQKVKGRAKTEASGGVNLAGVQTIAKTGVDFISIGALTHSAHAVDMGLDFGNDFNPPRSRPRPRLFDYENEEEDEDEMT